METELIFNELEQLTIPNEKIAQIPYQKDNRQLNHSNQESTEENKENNIQNLQCYDFRDSSSLKTKQRHIIQNSYQKSQQQEVNDNPNQIQQQQNYFQKNNVQNNNNNVNQQNVKKTDQAYLNLITFPSDLLNYESTLIELNFSYNNFIIFPTEICYFKQLKILKFDKNFITTLPSKIDQLTSLKVISIANNLITHLPKSLKNLYQNLLILNLGQNCLENFSEEITDLINLKVLYIQNNNFTDLPSKFYKLTNLIELQLDWLYYTYPPSPILLQAPEKDPLIFKIINLCFSFSRDQKEWVPFDEFIKHLSLEKQYFKYDSDVIGQNIMFLAAQREEIGVMKALFKKNVNLLNFVDSSNYSPLSIALEDGKFKSVRALLQLGSDPKLGGGQLGTNLHLAVKQLNLEFVNKFLRMGYDSNTLDMDLNAPLHIIFSIFSKNFEVAEAISLALIKNGANPNLKNKEFWSPLQLAARKNQIEAFQFASTYNRINKDQQSKELLFDFNIRGGVYKWSLYHIASNLGNLRVIEYLSDENADIFQLNKNHQTPRQVAVQSMLLYKQFRKYQQRWIKLNVLQKLKNGNEEFQKQEILSMENIIKQTWIKKQNFNEQNQNELFEKDNQDNNNIHDSFAKQKMQQMKESKPFTKLNHENNDEDQMWDSKSQISFDKLKQISEIDLCSIDEHLENHKVNVTKATHNKFSECGQNNINNNQVNNSINQKLMKRQQRELEAKDVVLEYKDIQSLKNKNFISEIERLTNLLTETNVVLTQKLRIINFLKIVHFRLCNKQVRFHSEIIPLNIYLLNEYFAPNMEKQQLERFQIMPQHFLKSLTNLVQFFCDFNLNNNNQNYLNINNNISNNNICRTDPNDNILLTSEIITLLSIYKEKKIQQLISKLIMSQMQNEQFRKKFNRKNLIDYEGFQAHRYLESKIKLNGYTREDLAQKSMNQNIINQNKIQQNIKSQNIRSHQRSISQYETSNMQKQQQNDVSNREGSNRMVSEQKNRNKDLEDVKFQNEKEQKNTYMKEISNFNNINDIQIQLINHSKPDKQQISSHNFEDKSTDIDLQPSSPLRFNNINLIGQKQSYFNPSLLKNQINNNHQIIQNNVRIQQQQNNNVLKQNNVKPSK